MQVEAFREDRGQLIVVASLVLATLFVTLALVLNSGIYAENLETRGTTDSSDVTTAVHQTNHEAAAAMRAANRLEATANPDNAVATFAANLEHIADGVTDQRTLRGQAFTIERRDAVGGYSLRQTADDRSFTNATGASTWTLATDVDRIDGYELRVERNSLYEDPGTVGEATADTFSLRLEDENGDEWRVHVFRNTADDSVVVVGGSGSEIDGLDSSSDVSAIPGYDDDACRASTASAEIDLAAGALLDADCPVLSFADELSGRLELSYHNGAEVNGTYRLLIDGPEPDDADFHVPDDGASPYRAGAVLEATIEVTYERSDIRYATSQEVSAEPTVYDADA